MISNTDPDYDSETDGPIAFDLLLRRTHLTVVDPRTGKRGPPSDVQEFTEWNRRRVEGQDSVEEEEIAYPGYEMEQGGSDGEDE